MKYIGEFKNINEELYKIEIVTNNDISSTTELLLADNPIVTTIENGDILYKSCKYSSATIRVLLNQPYFDLYSSKAKDVKVTLLNNNVIQWIGYVEPSVYSQDYESDYDVCEIECIDGLAVLDYIQYPTINNDAQIHTIFEIIRNVVKQSECYNNIYIAKSYITDITKFEIAEQNFFDEDGNAMTCKEVLEQIAQYLGFTCIADKDNVVFIDYDAIKNNINDYYVINVNNISITTTSISSNKILEVDDYSQNGQQISLDNVYNKVVIKDDLYAVDSVIPDIFDDDTLTNVTKGDYIEVKDESLVWPETGRDNYMIYTQYFQSSNCKSNYYDVTYNTDFPNQYQGETWENNWSGDTLNLLSNPTELDYEYVKSKVGATLIKREQVNITQNPDTPNKLNLENILLITPLDALSKTDKVLFCVPINIKQIFAKNFHFVVNFQCAISNQNDNLLLDNYYHSGEWELQPTQLYIRAQLYFNGKYWNGSNYDGESVGEWTETPSTFNIYLYSDSTKNFTNKYFEVKNTIKWNQFLNTEGFDIPIPDGKLNGQGEFRILSVDRRLAVNDKYTKGEFRKEENGDEGTSTDKFYYMGVEQDVYYIKDFTLDLITPNNEYINNDDSNTEYSNIINDEYIKELSDITFKICTWDNKKANYSCVICGDNYLDTTEHKIFNKLLRQEEHLIEKIVNQYSTPSVIFNFNLFNEYLPYSTISYMNKIFIIDSMTINYAYNTAQLKIIEKK